MPAGFPAGTPWPMPAGSSAFVVSVVIGHAALQICQELPIAMPTPHPNAPDTAGSTGIFVKITKGVIINKKSIAPKKKNSANHKRRRTLFPPLSRKSSTFSKISIDYLVTRGRNFGLIAAVTLRIQAAPVDGGHQLPPAWLACIFALVLAYATQGLTGWPSRLNADHSSLL